MTELYEKTLCSKCKKLNYCIMHPDFMVFLCQECFCWALGYADKKDKLNLLFKKIPDIEN